MITSYATLIPATATKVFVSSTTGASIGGAVTGQVNAITTIALCNTGAPTLTDETINSVTVNIYFVKSGFTYALCAYSGYQHTIILLVLVYHYVPTVL